MLNYVPHPRHILYAIFIIAIGFIVMIRDGWVAFGTILIIGGIVTWMVISARILVDGYKEYWSELGYFISAIEHIKDQSIRHHVWTFFGFNAPARDIKVIEKDESLGAAYPQYKIHELPIPVHMMQMIADNVLTGKSFSEQEMKSIMPGSKFRKYQKIFREKELVKPNNRKSNNMGFSFTRKGTQILYSFASETVKQQLKEKGVKLDAT